jgi:hypothetical protein
MYDTLAVAKAKICFPGADQKICTNSHKIFLRKLVTIYKAFLSLNLTNNFRSKWLGNIFPFGSCCSLLNTFTAWRIPVVKLTC